MTATIADLAAEARIAAITTCPTHPNDPTPTILGCPFCIADRKVAGDRDWLGHHATLRALAGCDRHIPLRFRDAEPTVAAVGEWVRAVIARPVGAPSLLLLGPAGRGKTWQAYGAIRTVLAELPGLTWRSTGFADFTARLRPGAGVDTEAEMRHHQGVDLLLLDDIGTGKSSEWVEEVTYRLVDHRYAQMLPSIFVSNLPPDGLAGVLGDRVASRLRESCRLLRLDGPDLRRMGAP